MSLERPHDQRLGVELELVAGGPRLSPGVEAGRPLFKGGRVPVEAPVAVLQVLPVVLGEQRVEERVDAAVAVGQTRHQVVDAGVCVRGQVQGLGVVQRQQLPDPEGQETRPEHQHDGEDHDQHLLLRGAFPASPDHRVALWLQVGARQPDVQVSNDDARCHDAGAKQGGHVHFIGKRRPCGRAHPLYAPTRGNLRGLGHHDHHGHGEDQREQPHAPRQSFAVTLGAAGRVQRFGDGQVALRAHDSEGEDAGVHGEQVQAEKDAASNIAEVPVLQEIGGHHERDGGEVEQVRHGQVNDGDVHGGGEADGVAHHHQSVDVSRHPDDVNDREQRPESGGDDAFTVRGPEAAAVPTRRSAAEMWEVVVHPVRCPNSPRSLGSRRSFGEVSTRVGRVSLVPLFALLLFCAADVSGASKRARQIWLKSW